MFSDEELERYSRQILVRDFGGAAQAKLKAAHIAVIGAGGIGAPLLLYLTGAGVGKISLFEDDEVSLSNLHRQVLYQSNSVGQPKAGAALDALQSLNANVELNALGRFEGSVPEGATLIVDGSDRLETRQLANRAAKSAGLSLVAASLAQWEGQIAHYDPAHHAGCYECLYPEGTDSAAVPRCSEAGVIGAVAGVVGTFAALEAIKIVTDIRPLLPAQMMMFDGLYREMRMLNVSARSDCPVCSGAS